MPKSQFQDILPPEKKSIKQIPLPDRREKAPARKEREEKVEEEYVDTPRVPKSRRPKKRMWPKFVTALVIILVIVAGYFAIPKVSGSQITLTLRGQNVSVDAELVAVKDSNSKFAYKTVSDVKEGKITVASTGEEKAEVKAKGTIRIFNNFSSDAQKLIANTRFETSDGLIFRITSPVTIPGKSGSTAGSLDAEVTADQTGPKYNIGLSDFTIPGFKGTEKAGKIFARSVTPMIGGFSGMRSKVDQATLDSSYKKIEAELESALTKKIMTSIPADFILPQNSYFITYEKLQVNPVTATTVEIGERATIHAVIFKKTDLAKAISEKAGLAKTENTLGDMESISIKLKGDVSQKPWDAAAINFSVKGTTTLISSVDTDKLKTELAGAPRNSLKAILSSYNGIEKAEVTMRPFWKQYFPKDSKAITILISKTLITP